MKFHNIEVSGIRNITFNRKALWQADGGMWRKVDLTNAPAGVFDIIDSKTHEEMMKIVNLLKWDRRYRMWIHGDTLNIVRKSVTVNTPWGEAEKAYPTNKELLKLPT